MPVETGPSPNLSNGAGGMQVGAGNVGEPILGRQGAPAAKTAAATLTAAEITGGLITYTGVTANLTLPTVAALETYVPNAGVNSSFDFSLIDLGGAGQPTIVTNTGWTLVGDVSPASGTAQRYRARKTGDAAWTLYQIG